MQQPSSRPRPCNGGAAHTRPAAAIGAAIATAIATAIAAAIAAAICISDVIMTPKIGKERVRLQSMADLQGEATTTTATGRFAARAQPLATSCKGPQVGHPPLAGVADALELRRVGSMGGSGNRVGGSRENCCLWVLCGKRDQLVSTARWSCAVLEERECTSAGCR